MQSVDFVTFEIEQVSWNSAREQIAQIRRLVLIDELALPENAVFDDNDGDALHWLVFGLDREEPIATARLLSSGRISHMAVLKTSRNQGAGAALVRKITNYAMHENYSRMDVEASARSVAFFEDLGFTVVGAPSKRDGVLWRNLELNLDQYRHPVTQHELPEIAEEEKIRQSLDGQDAFIKAAAALVEATQQKLYIFSNQLEPHYLADEKFTGQLSALALRHPYAEIRLLIRNTDVVRGNTHPILLLKERLPSSIKVRKLRTELHCEHCDFVLGDNQRILYQQEERRPVGFVQMHAPLEGRELGVDFEHMWEHSEPDPQLRRLHL